MKTKNPFLHTILIWLVITPIQVVLAYVFNTLSHLDISFYSKPDEIIANQPLLFMIYQSCFFGPILETAIQAVVFYGLSQMAWMKAHKAVIILIGGLCFSLLHFFSLFYIIFSCIMGSIFMYVYVKMQNPQHKYGGAIAYICTAMIHGLTNGVSFWL